MILFPDEALRAGEARIGGKALGLARLHEAGAKVPPWFVVSADAYRAHVARNGLGAELAAAGGDGDGARLRAAVERAPIDPALAAAVEDALGGLGPGPYAVRSSMVGEDSAKFSFAGQCDTFLFQPDAAAVLSSLRACWASAFTDRALAYRRRAGATLDAAMCVVVQRMVDGRVSGVLFTAHPVTGRRDHALLTAAWGLGEGIVSGACDTDEYVWAHGGGEVTARVAKKDVAVVRSSAGAGTAEVPVPEARRAARCLAPAEVARVCAEGLRVAERLGAPQDIEWTIDGDELLLLQSRPITAAAVRQEAPPTGPRIIWDNSNIQESYCGVTTPLTFSFALGAYTTVYEQFFRALGLTTEEIEPQREVLRNLLGLVKGRVYYNINNWYRILLVLPSFGKNKADMEKMMGLEEPVDFVEDQVLSRLEKARRAPRLLATFARMKLRFRTLDRDVAAFMARFEDKVGGVDRAALRQLGLSELMTTLARLRAEILGRWHTPIINDLYVMMYSGQLRRLCEQAVGKERAPELWNRLVAGEPGIESTEPTRRLLRLARAARDDAALAAELRAGAPAEAWARVRAKFPAFARELDAYLQRYGDRCMGELKLETRSLHEDPSFLVQVLRNYLDRPDLDAETLAARERKEREVAERELRGRLGPAARLRAGGVLRAARRGIKARETMRLARTRGFGVIRELYLAIGQRLFEAGRLDEPRDVFYLTVEELDAWHAGRAVAADLAALARVRKAEFHRYEAEPVPNRVETVGPVYQALQSTTTAPAAPAEDARVLRGLGCSPGVVEAALRVVRSPQDDLALNGRILTALRTDPGWGPLFPSASGVLIERGSTLSHSAVLARELGIPAVVGVPRLLEIVRDGERVRLDGGRGVVERLDQGQA